MCADHEYMYCYLALVAAMPICHPDECLDFSSTDIWLQPCIWIPTVRQILI